MGCIVAIDDNELDLISLRKALEDKFELHTFLNPLEGLHAIQDLFPSLIILDIQMPMMDGYEVCSKIKGNESTKGIPIVFVSGKNSSSSRSLAYRLGAINYLNKPYEPDELKSLVKSIMIQVSEGNDKDVIELGALTLDMKGLNCTDGRQVIKLTPSECVILETLMINEGNPVNREVLVNKIRKYNTNPAFRGIDTHVSSLRKKIKSSDLKITSVYSIGYCLQKVGRAIA